MTKRSYKVNTVPMFECGGITQNDVTFVVTTNGESTFVSALGFGTSRNMPTDTTDQKAIEMFLSASSSKIDTIEDITSVMINGLRDLQIENYIILKTFCIGEKVCGSFINSDGETYSFHSIDGRVWAHTDNM